MAETLQAARYILKMMIGVTAGGQISVVEALRIFNRSQIFVCLGAVITAVGVLAAAFSMLRRRLDSLLLWFALFAILYGVRLAIHYQPMWQLGMHPQIFERVAVGIGYLVPIPAFLFFITLKILNAFGRRLVILVSPVLVALSVATLAIGPRYLLSNINSFVMMILLTILAVELLMDHSKSADTRLIHRGLMIFIGCALYENLAEFLPLPYFNIEPFSFVVLLGALGIVAGRRTLAREQQLTLIEKELQIAQRIQLSILPGSFPQSRSFRVAARYQPMTAVAGDLYEFLLSDDDEAGLLIADVSGHGVPAALIASMVKMAATSQRSLADDPAAVLTGMNAALCGNTQAQFVTAGYVYLNARTRELRYAAAAHPPMLLLRGGEVTEVEENGLMLAAFDSASYSTRTMRLEQGDRLVMYTDGLLEAANGAEEEFGSERLRAAVRESGGLPVTEASVQIVAGAQDWSVAQNDDLTVIVCDCVT
jgi:phosphoserine phosphatase RsbU/P